jgi:protein involved in polysaccharide export with SLBB domain
MIRFRAAVLGAALLALTVSERAVAQQTAADSALYKLTVGRDSLQVLLAQLDSLGEATSGNNSAKQRAKNTAQLIRNRLERGDFQAGDRIRLQVDSEPQLTDTFPVGPSQELVLPVVGIVSLRGVLRAELQVAMSRELGRFLRDPIVRATPLIRVSIIGEVNRPGFYLLPPASVVSDVVTAAGGPTQNAKVEKMWVERGGRRLVEGQQLQSLMAEGLTLDDANVRPGDKFVVPANSTGSFFNVVRTVSIILSIPLTIYALTQVFKK